MGIYQDRIKKLLSHDRVSSLFPVLEYIDEDEHFLLEGPYVGAMLICTPSPGGNEEIRNALTNMYRKDYPKDTIIQASLVSLPDIENNLYGYNAIRKGRMNNEDASTCESMSESIHDFFRKGAKEPINDSGFIFRNFELWFTIKMPIADALPTSDETERFKELCRSMRASLSKFHPKIANESDFKRRMNVLLNIHSGGDWRDKANHEDKAFVGDCLNEMLLENGKRLEVKPSGVSISGSDGKEVQFMKSLSINKMPETMVYGSMINLLGDWRHGVEGYFEHFMITLNIVYPDKNKAKAKFSKSRGFINTQAKGFLLQHIDRLRWQKRDFDTVNRELEQENSRIVDYSMHITIFSKNEDRAEKFAERIIGGYSELNVELIRDDYFALPMILGALPFGVDSEFKRLSSRFKTGTTKSLAWLTPHCASWKGNTAYPTFMLASRFGQVVNLDFFKAETSYNAFIGAESGAGKSFMTAYLVNAMLGCGISKHRNPRNPKEKFDDGSQVFIIDAGKSYYGLASQYENSQFLEFGMDCKYSLNPFPSINEFYGRDGQINMVRSLIKTMASPTGTISDFQNAEILSVLKELWDEHGKRSTITRFANLCELHEDEEMKRLGKQLRPFCEDGIYGDFFSDKYPPASFDSRMMVCELDQLKNDPHLQVAVLMAVIMKIQNAMFLSGQERRKMFILDEGWEYLKEDGSTSAKMLQFFAEFLETGWRRFRKYNAAGLLISQSVLDAYQSSVGRAILANSPWLLLMRQTGETINTLEETKKYDGSKSDFDLIRSLRTKKPEKGVSDEAFSEVFVRFDGATQVCRLYTDRELQLILTTNSDEKNVRQKYIDKGLTLLQAVRAMIADGH